MVDELFRLVSMLLIAAANNAAINNPARPTGIWLAIKCGNTLSP